MNGLAVLVPLEVTPVMLILATVLLETFETAPPVTPLKAMPTNDDAKAPVNVYVPVCAAEENPTMFPVIVNPCAPVVAVVFCTSMPRWATPAVQVLVPL